MQFNQINSQAINKLLRVLQCLGLALWKVTFISSGNTQQRVIFSRYSLIFSILIVFIVICAIITQHSKLLVGFETIYSSKLSVTVRHIHKMTHYLRILEIFVPVWIFRRQMKLIYEKLLLVKWILNNLHREMAENVVLVCLTVRILIWITVVITLTILEINIGMSIANNQSSYHQNRAVGVRFLKICAFFISY